MRRPEVDLASADSVVRHLIAGGSLRARVGEFALAVVDAHAMIHRFASDHGWRAHIRVPLCASVRVCETQDALRHAIRSEAGELGEYPPADGLSAGVCSGCLMAVSPEEYERIWPEYGRVAGAWTRLLAHEMAHELHARVAGAEELMGPRWFYEGFALHAAGQRMGQVVTTAGAAADAMRAGSRGAYAKYAAAFEFFHRHVTLDVLVRRASEADFEDWLVAMCGAESRAGHQSPGRGR